MSINRPRPTQVERFFDQDQIIVSKTDLKGRLTYVNSVFLKISGFSEEDLLGQPHNLIRHPDMPRCVFHLLWERIGSGKEVFAFVKNMAINGDHYWVHAHVTPTRDRHGAVVGYHSNRRVPDRAGIDAVMPLYRDLLAQENRFPRGPEGLAASRQMLLNTLTKKETSYDEWVFSLQ